MFSKNFYSNCNHIKFIQPLPQIIEEPTILKPSRPDVWKEDEESKVSIPEISKVIDLDFLND
jgi:hypothetical protein